MPDYLIRKRKRMPANTNLPATTGLSQSKPGETIMARYDAGLPVEKDGYTSISSPGSSTHYESRKNQRTVMVHEDDVDKSSSPLTIEKFLRRSARLNNKNNGSKNKKKSVDLSLSSPTETPVLGDEDDREHPPRARKRPNRVSSPLPLDFKTDPKAKEQGGEVSSSRRSEYKKRSAKDVSTPKKPKERKPPISQRLLQAAVLSKVDIDDGAIAKKPGQETSFSRRPLNFVAHGSPSSPTLRARALRSRKAVIVSPYKPMQFENSSFEAHTLSSSTSLRKRPLMQASLSTPTPVRTYQVSPIKRPEKSHRMENALPMTPTSGSRSHHSSQPNAQRLSGLVSSKRAEEGEIPPLGKILVPETPPRATMATKHSVDEVTPVGYPRGFSQSRPEIDDPFLLPSLKSSDAEAVTSPHRQSVAVVSAPIQAYISSAASPGIGSLSKVFLAATRVAALANPASFEEKGRNRVDGPGARRNRFSESEHRSRPLRPAELQEFHEKADESVAHALNPISADTAPAPEDDEESEIGILPSDFDTL